MTKVLQLSFLTLALLSVFAFGDPSRYNLTKPDQTMILPDTLREISDLTSIDSSSFACIQDENGIIFIYDAINNRIKKQYTFNLNGDYEGIARVGKSLFVLRSDGVLFRISDFDSKSFKVASYETGIPAQNNEGLCYDEKNNRLLIASKSNAGKGKELKDKRAIYGFDLSTMKLSAQPVFDLDVNTIRAYVLKNNIRLNETEKGKDLKFRPSAIAIHPINKKLYLLSASDHLFFIFNMNGDIEHIEALDPIKFNKPEGITFFENGDMLITNEGQEKKATLLRFNSK